MTTLNNLLDSFRNAAVTEREKGTYFEELICTYLRNEAIYRDLYSDVWTYADWAQEQGLDKRDTGIDLVARTNGTREYHAIQCKFYAEDYRVQKSDIDSFFTASGKKHFTYRIIVSTTNHWSEHAEEALRDQQPPVSKIDRHDLENSQIDWSKYQNTDQLLKQLLITSEFAAEPNDRKFHICLYGSEFEQKVFRAKTIERDLAHIIDHPDDGSLYLHFQPIIDLKTRSVRAFEALSRLRSPELGLIPPLEFIPIAEKTKFIIPLGKIIIGKAFQFLQMLHRHGCDEIMVSINISVIQLLDQDFPDMFLDMMRTMKVSPQNVGIEVTESEFVMNYDEINKVLSQLKGAGIHISMDDFGTGYSSLAREKELDIHCLKIDKFFIDRLVTTNPLKSMTAFIVSMAHQFDQCVVAEGVEHESQMEALIECGCDFAQGYLFSKPLDDIHALEFIGTFPV